MKGLINNNTDYAGKLSMPCCHTVIHCIVTHSCPWIDRFTNSSQSIQVNTNPMAHSERLATTVKLSTITTCTTMNVCACTLTNPPIFDHRWHCVYTEFDWPTPQQMRQDWHYYNGATFQLMCCCTCRQNQSCKHVKMEPSLQVHSIHAARTTPFNPSFPLAWYRNQ